MTRVTHNNLRDHYCPTLSAFFSSRYPPFFFLLKFSHFHSLSPRTARIPSRPDPQRYPKLSPWVTHFSYIHPRPSGDRSKIIFLLLLSSSILIHFFILPSSSSILIPTLFTRDLEYNLPHSPIFCLTFLSFILIHIAIHVPYLLFERNSSVISVWLIYEMKDNWKYILR